jgi:hypothetical protein
VTSTWLAIAAAVTLAPQAGAQPDSLLDRAVEQARAAWLSHAVGELVAHSDTVRLRLPGVAASAATRPAQAARLLEEYLSAATEESFTLRELRYAQADHAYAELSRRYAVRGTDDIREETVFLGFRRVGGQWRLREVRIAP